MMRWAQLPIKYRLSIALGLGMAAVLTGLSVFVYGKTGADLIDAIDVGLRSRAELLIPAALAAAGGALLLAFAPPRVPQEGG